MANCKNCGTTIDDGALQCPACGAAASDNQESLLEVQSEGGTQQNDFDGAGQQANYDGQQPNYGGQQPNYGGQQPNYGGQQPNYGGQQPNYGGQQPNYGGQQQQSGFGAAAYNFNNTADNTAQYHPMDIQQNKVMAVLSYIGILVLIPIFAAKESRFARFHANQGLVLAIAEVAYGIIYAILNSILLSISWRLMFISTILSLVYIAFLVFAILGIVNAASGRAKELPLIGKLRILK
ncbi:MAG TPA: zinc-ribbon domain-containing protein [Clostridiaceae bacterium]|nr:zinc-ribbon domain-containing protein [Clostridiaceae bacterium]